MAQQYSSFYWDAAGDNVSLQNNKIISLYTYLLLDENCYSLFIYFLIYPDDYFAHNISSFKMSSYKLILN